jgi:uncharacterized protein YifE (UPF0438 family)
MKYEDWLTEEVLKFLEGYSPAGQVGTPIGGPSNPTSIYGNDIDTLRAKDDEEEEKIHYRLEERPASPRKKEIKLTWETLPMPNISEIAWSEPKSSERKEMASFLKRIGGNEGDLPTKLAAIQGVVEEGFKKGTAMSTVLSYLVFLKTLTYIIQSFNSASAGFTFESFLGVLLGGEQIPTGQDTIADYQTGAGEYISLKLLTQKGSIGGTGKKAAGSTIDGSYTQLIDDLSGTSGINSDRMKYVIALKDFEGKGTDLGGTISVYEFVIDRGTLQELMSQNTESKESFSLMTPKSRKFYYGNREATKEELDDFMPAFLSAAKEMDGPERAVLYNKYRSLISKALAKRAPELLDLSAEEVAAEAWESLSTGEFSKDFDISQDPVGSLLKRSVKSIWDTQNKDRKTKANLDKQRKGKLEFMSFDKSAAELAGIKDDAEYFDTIKKYSRGYVTTGQFKITQDPIMKGVGNAIKIGSLSIGRDVVEKALKQSVTDVNERMFAAFEKMNTLASSLQQFFLQGLRDTDGEQAIAASRGVKKDTEDVMKQKKK